MVACWRTGGSAHHSVAGSFGRCLSATSSTRTVRTALEREGWLVTHDPLPLRFGARRLFVDLGAEAPIAAEKSGRKIAVEVKSSLGDSDMRELEQALGRYALYRFLLDRDDPTRALFLAVASEVFGRLFDDADGRDLVAAQHVRLIVFDVEKGAVTTTSSSTSAGRALDAFTAR